MRFFCNVDLEISIWSNWKWRTGTKWLFLREIWEHLKDHTLNALVFAPTQYFVWLEMKNAFVSRSSFSCVDNFVLHQNLKNLPRQSYFGQWYWIILLEPYTMWDIWTNNTHPRWGLLNRIWAKLGPLIILLQSRWHYLSCWLWIYHWYHLGIIKLYIAGKGRVHIWHHMYMCVCVYLSNQHSRYLQHQSSL